LSGLACGDARAAVGAREGLAVVEFGDAVGSGPAFAAHAHVGGEFVDAGALWR